MFRARPIVCRSPVWPPRRLQSPVTNPKPCEPLEFPDRKAWAKWLDRYFAQSPGVWVRLAKKSHQGKLLVYDEAIEEALCVGWIDALKRAESATTWLQRFTPRKPKSIWSKINRSKALALIESGGMKAG